MLLPFAFGASVCSPRGFVEVESLKNLLLLGLWTLDARVVLETLAWSLVAVREPPIPLWVVPRIVVERLRILPRRNTDSGR